MWLMVCKGCLICFVWDHHHHRHVYLHFLTCFCHASHISFNFFLWTLCWGRFRPWHLLFPLHFLSQTFVVKYFLECTQLFGCIEGFCCVAFWPKKQIRVFCYVIPCQVANRDKELEIKSEVCHRVSCRAALSFKILVQAVISLLCDNQNQFLFFVLIIILKMYINTFWGPR